MNDSALPDFGLDVERHDFSTRQATPSFQHNPWSTIVLNITGLIATA